MMPSNVFPAALWLERIVISSVFVEGNGSISAFDVPQRTRSRRCLCLQSCRENIRGGNIDYRRLTAVPSAPWRKPGSTRSEYDTHTHTHTHTSVTHQKTHCFFGASNVHSQMISRVGANRIFWVKLLFTKNITEDFLVPLEGETDETVSSMQEQHATLNLALLFCGLYMNV